MPSTSQSSTSHPSPQIVITGIGIISSIGIGEADFFAALLRGDSGIRSLGDRTDGDVAPAEGQDVDGVWIGAPVVDFNAKQFVKPRKALKVMCREIQTAFASAQLAIEHAGMGDLIPAGSDGGAMSPERLGAVYGSEIFFNPPEELAAPIRACLDESGTLHPELFGNAARREVMPLWMLKYLPNMPACQIGISLNSQGPNNSLVLGDVSGPASLIEAVSYLKRGLADVVLVGATGTRIAAMRLTYRGDSPTVQKRGLELADVSRPFAPDATGVVGGEGAASLVVETADEAAKRSAKPLARVLATASRFCPTPAMRSGCRSDDGNPSHSREASQAITAAIESVLRDAKVSADKVGLVVSHAFGDRQLDAGEAAAIAECQLTCPVVAVSASLGHCGAASGMIGLATGVAALARRVVPPTRNASAAVGVHVLTESQPLGSPYVLCLSHTTEGSAVAVLLGESSPGMKRKNAPQDDS